MLRRRFLSALACVPLLFRSPRRERSSPLVVSVSCGPHREPRHFRRPRAGAAQPRGQLRRGTIGASPQRAPEDTPAARPLRLMHPQPPRLRADAVEIRRVARLAAGPAAVEDPARAGARPGGARLPAGSGCRAKRCGLAVARPVQERRRARRVVEVVHLGGMATENGTWAIPARCSSGTICATHSARDCRPRFPRADRWYLPRSGRGWRSMPSRLAVARTRGWDHNHSSMAALREREPRAALTTEANSSVT